jgi:hypothetical protein
MMYGDQTRFSAEFEFNENKAAQTRCKNAEAQKLYRERKKQYIRARACVEGFVFLTRA